MKALHSATLQTFARRLKWLLGLRAAVQLVTVWLFLWGVTVLVVRISSARDVTWLAFGLLGIVPVALFAGWHSRRQLPAFGKLRASYDRLNACGGIIMSEETADMTAWQSHLPGAILPELRWRSGQAMFYLFISALFAATALLLPERLTNFSNHRRLEIGQIVGQLQAEVKMLRQEKILDDKTAGDLQNQLTQLQKDATSFDPNKTWEALDHIKESNSESAKQAAEEAIAKTESLTQAETVARAMEQAADSGMNEATASQAAQDLASMLKAAKLEEGILNGQVPPELLSGLNGLDKEQMQKLLSALELNKNSLGLTASNLANLKMIDPAALAKLQNAGHTPDYGGLADYLSQCKGGDGDELFSWLHKAGKGGPGGGGPEADITWNDGASEKDLKFQQHALSPASRLSDAQLVGVSKAAPELSDNKLSTGQGALDNVQGSGGSAHSQMILPEQRQAVQNFFKREQ